MVYRVSEDLRLELCNDPPALVLRFLSMERDGESPGAVTVWPDEVTELRRSLADGMAVLASWIGEDGGDGR
jgi:hypothetical protein